MSQNYSRYRSQVDAERKLAHVFFMIAFLLKPIGSYKIPRQMKTVSQQPAALKVLWIKKQESLKH